MADHRHKRETNARRTPRAVVIAGPLAVLATASAVTLGVLTTGGSPASPVVAADVSSAPSPATREAPVSRGLVTRREDKVVVPGPLSKAATRLAVRKAKTRLWSTTDLNLWTRPGAKAEEVGELDAATRVLVTGRTIAGREEIVVDGVARWVTRGYLSEDKPLGVGAGLSMAPCPDPGVESGLTSAAVYVYRSVCNAFPQITTYGGWDNHGEHSSGRAIDIMTSDVTLGTAIAEFLQAHASELDLYDILWRQHIWTPVRAGEGWRSMSDRGSTTANHYDHVHVSVN